MKANKLRRDNKPYTIRLLINFCRRLYTKWRLVPQFDDVGSGLEIIGPHRLEVYGPNIRLGDNVHMQTSSGNMSRICTWSDGEGGFGRIDIGSHILLTPGLQMVSAKHIEIGDNVMIASRVYISDADWHDIYNRLETPGPRAAVKIGKNAWIGYGSIICKGADIGENSVIGAGSVVTGKIPANVIAAGNPAKVIRRLDEDTQFTKRSSMFEDIKSYNKTMSYLHYLNHKNNSYLGWLRQLIAPSRKG